MPRGLRVRLVARLACERALARRTDDEWTWPTLLGLAFFEGNVAVVDDLCDQISADGRARWKLASTIVDPEGSVARTEAADARVRLQAALDQRKALI